jgi:polyisoprenoid-binding protein YceI
MTMATPAEDRSALTGTWVLDPSHSRLGFSARHAMIATVRGGFGDISGTITLDGTKPSASHAEVTIQAASISTGADARDDHLRSADFLDVESHPTITFVSTAAEEGDGPGEYRLTGDLTIRNVTRPVVLDVEYRGSAADPFGNRRAGFELRGTINRKDFGLTWNAALEGGGILVSDKVKLELDISAIRQE